MQEVLRQLHAVGALQRHLLPRTLPRMPGWELAVHYTVGVWPGGDYYDLLPLPDGRLLVFVAGTSEQGAPASALVAMTRVLLHSCPLSSGVERLPFCPLHEPVLQPPHVLLGHLNRVLAENSLEEQFLTAFCGVLDPVEGNLHYANAGHPFPRLWRASTGRVEPVREAAGLPLALDFRTCYHHRRTQLEPGDVLVLYSEGLTTALNDRGDAFGCDRLDGAIRTAAAGGAEAIKALVLSWFDQFLGSRRAPGDMTLVVAARER
jgi:sigma-B regulation protein RsbU (phosphoserine phosphatase)